VVGPTSPVLEALERGAQDLLLDRAVSRALRPGQNLFMAGDPATRAHIVTDGVIKLSARNSEGRTAILGLALPGELVGEIAALDGRPQPLDAVAATRAQCLGVDAEALLSVMTRNPTAALVVARALASKARALYASAAERTTGGAPARLAGRLLALAEVLGRVTDGAVELELPLPQEDLGGLAGMCRESACKTLRTFKRAGLLEYRGRRVRILCPEALERIRAAGRYSAEQGRDREAPVRN
jgi:CRP-like cAMP-binding protein